MAPIKEEFRNNNEGNFLKGILDGIDDDDDFLDNDKNKIFHNNEILTFEEEK